MSLRVRLFLLWAISSLLVIFLLFITGFLIFRRFSPADQEILIEVLFPFRFYLLLPLVFFVLALIWGAKWFLEKYWFPLERMLEELELVRTVNSSLRIQTQGSTQLKTLAAKFNQNISGVVMWTLIGRTAMGFFLPEDSSFFFMRFFVRSTDPLLRFFAPVTPGFLLPALVPLYVAWFFYMLRFYLMPWLLGYTVMGMLSFPLESEIAGLIYRILSPQ